jgi:SAM-dependent methyltransferase
MSAPTGAVDWGLGHYEHTAAQLLPAARAVVERARIAAGEHVVDVGCGTGNAALLAAERGARVIGIDPAARLIEVASEQAAAQRLDATFATGTAAQLPLADGAADAVLSVFGVIFAPDPEAAAAEMARITAPAGRIVISAWIPGGAISESARVARETVRRAVGAPAGPPPFAWHDRDALAPLLEPHGFAAIDVAEEHHTFTGASPAEYLATEFESHPMWVAGRAILEPRGELDALRDRMLAILEAGNEDAAAFRVTSRYVVATARRRQLGRTCRWPKPPTDPASQPAASSRRSACGSRSEPNELR